MDFSKLFSMGLEEIIQNIFLHLDPKSLKNSKLTCTQWKEFIDRRIWRSPAAKKILHARLLSNWKDEDESGVKISKFKLEDYVASLNCDGQVITVVYGCENRTLRVFSSSTHNLLYSLDLSEFSSHFRIGDDFIFLKSLHVND